MQRGFSLVELSIVLVILGLLTGGILAGQSLIRAAELRSATTDYQRYMTAIYSFRDRYMALPGDMTNATSFWGSMSVCPNGGGTGTQTCNGNGNGELDTGVALYHESVQAWKQLANAGLIEGSYTGTWQAGIGMIAGTNVPPSKFGQGGYSLAKVSATQYGIWKSGQDGNVIAFGVSQNNLMSGPILKPEEAWNIDTKLDDGIAFRGSILGNHVLTSCFDNTPPADANYNLTSTDISCALRFLIR